VSFVPYVHQTGLEGGVKYGGRIGQEVKKKRSRTYRC
jgi:hypothetical protein